MNKINLECEFVTEEIVQLMDSVEKLRSLCKYESPCRVHFKMEKGISRIEYPIGYGEGSSYSVWRSYSESLFIVNQLIADRLLTIKELKKNEIIGLCKELGFYDVKISFNGGLISFIKCISNGLDHSWYGSIDAAIEHLIELKKQKDDSDEICRKHKPKQEGLKVYDEVYYMHNGSYYCGKIADYRKDKYIIGHEPLNITNIVGSFKAEDLFRTKKELIDSQIKYWQDLKGKE